MLIWRSFPFFFQSMMHKSPTPPRPKKKKCPLFFEVVFVSSVTRMPQSQGSTSWEKMLCHGVLSPWSAPEEPLKSNDCPSNQKQYCSAWIAPLILPRSAWIGGGRWVGGGHSACGCFLTSNGGHQASAASPLYVLPGHWNQPSVPTAFATQKLLSSRGCRLLSW